MDTAATGFASVAGGSADPDVTRIDTAPPIPPGPGSGLAASSLQPGQKVANRYTVIRLLGAGGMAVVYQAWDDSLGVAVALKLIRIEGLIPIEVQQLQDRFKRELKLARQVTHPNVVRIHDLGEVGGTLYLTMEFVQGADLATRLRRDGRMPVPQALEIARQIASGLQAAHKAGVVHRDLKPANIMLTGEGHALLTDFGIARSTSAVTVHTVPGALIGTLEYMAPEQAQGGTADERTDIYAFGLILYELLAGVRPFATREGGLTDLLARLKEGPPPIRSVNPDVPADFEAIISKCLQQDPTARYQNAGELLSGLQSLGADGRRIPDAVARRRAPWTAVAAAVAASLLLIGGTWLVSSRRAPPPPAAPRESVSVLIADFDNKAKDPVFQESLEQALGIAVEGASFITAYPRRDAASLARQIRPGSGLDEATARLVATREGIRVILAGGIEQDGAGYRIYVNALDPASEKPIAVTDARASSKADVLAAVGKVAAKVRTALGDTVPSDQQQAETFTAGSLDAVRSYTIAQELSSNQKDQEAIDRYREATQHDPKFGRAYAGWASSAMYLGHRAEAEEMWKKALALGDRMTEREKLRTNGGYYLTVTQNFDKAIENYTTLVEKYPADLAGHSNLAVAYFYTLNFPKAIEEGLKATQIYPRSLKFRSNYALYEMYAGNFSKAAATAQQLVAEEPSLDSAYLPLAMHALAEANPDQARAVYQRAATTSAAGTSLAGIGLADIAIWEGRYNEAVRILVPGSSADRAAGNSIGEAAKLVAISESHAAAGRAGPAQAAATQALALGNDDSILVSVGRVLIGLGQTAGVQKISTELAGRLQPQSRAYGRLLEAERALKRGQVLEAITALRDARQLADRWLIRFVLGQAYAQAEQHAEALSEFETCLKRRGEATAIFLDDLPTFRYLATLSYWQGRSQDALGQRDGATARFKEFLALRGHRADDPLVVDARRRLEAAPMPAASSPR